MNNVVRIKKASFYAYHGALKEEQSIGGNFEADVDLYFDFSEAAKSDDLSKTINYDGIYKHINNIIYNAVRNGSRHFLFYAGYTGFLKILIIGFLQTDNPGYPDHG